MENILEIRGLGKNFGSTVALKDVHLDIRRGEIHGLVGVNGSGKSTLLNILFGSREIRDTGGYRGEIYLAGQLVQIRSTRDALSHGMGMIHQEFALIPEMTIAENIKLTQEKTKGGLHRFLPPQLAMLDPRKNAAEAAEALHRLGLVIDPDLTVRQLSTSVRQFVEIAREIDKQDLRLLFLDEPTAVLNRADSEKLLKTLQELAAGGTTIVFISHRLEEVCRICQRATVLRDGVVAARFAEGEMSVASLAGEMIGGEVATAIRREQPERKTMIMSLRDFHVDMPGEELRGLDLDIRQGEILGITSLSGHGKLAVGYGLAGYYPARGQVLYGKQPYDPAHTRKNIERGVYSLPDDRKASGLLLEHSVADNIIFTGFQIKNRFARGFLPGLSTVDRSAAAAHAEAFVQQFEIKCRHIRQKVSQLSGGNQQKVCLARALTLSPQLLFVAEPTRGVDIGAKEKLLQMLVQVNEQEGTTIVIASSELEELKRICDRIAVLEGGRLKALLPPSASDLDFALAIAGEAVAG